MPKKLDVSTLAPAHRARVLKDRALKAAQYAREKEKILARGKAWREANPDIVAEHNRAWSEAHPERKAAAKRASYDRNRMEVLRRQAARYQSLNDACVKGLFCKHSGLQSKDVPTELVPVIRTSILIKRELKTQRQSV